MKFYHIRIKDQQLQEKKMKLKTFAICARPSVGQLKKYIYSELPLHKLLKAIDLSLNIVLISQNNLS